MRFMTMGPVAPNPNVITNPMDRMEPRLSRPNELAHNTSCVTPRLVMPMP